MAYTVESRSVKCLGESHELEAMSICIFDPMDDGVGYLFITDRYTGATGT